MGDDQCRALDTLDDVRHGERLAAARDAHQRLVDHAPVDAVNDLINGLGLVSCRLEVGDYLKLGQAASFRLLRCVYCRGGFQTRPYLLSSVVTYDPASFVDDALSLGQQLVA